MNHTCPLVSIYFLSLHLCCLQISQYWGSLIKQKKKSLRKAKKIRRTQMTILQIQTMRVSLMIYQMMILAMTRLFKQCRVKHTHLLKQKRVCNKHSKRRIKGCQQRRRIILLQSEKQLSNKSNESKGCHLLVHSSHGVYSGSLLNHLMMLDKSNLLCKYSMRYLKYSSLRNYLYGLRLMKYWLLDLNVDLLK